VKDGHVTVDQYEQIPKFDDWLQSEPRVEILRTLQSHIERYVRAISTTGEAIDLVAQKLGREAAAETGAVEKIYALEPGETRTVVSGQLGWERVFTRQGSGLLEMFEDQVDAYEYVRSEVLGGFAMSEYWIRGLHARVCARQETYTAYVQLPNGDLAAVEKRLAHGQYKTEPNSVRRRQGEILHFAPVEEVGVEMARLVEECRLGTFEAADSATQAAYVHYCLTRIHPFSDGNGRTARALASVFTYASYQLPLIVYSDRRSTYLQALEAANEGRYGEFVEHFCYRMTDTMERAIQELHDLTSRSVEQELSALLNIRSAETGMTVARARDVAVQVFDHVEGAVGESIKALNRIGAERSLIEVVDDSPYGIPYSGTMPYDSGFESVRGLRLRGRMHSPAEVDVELDISIGVAHELSGMFAFFLATMGRRQTDQYKVYAELRMTYEDAFPEVSTSTVERISLFVRQSQRSLVQELALALRVALRQAGQSTD
jgi:Fic family protein